MSKPALFQYMILWDPTEKQIKDEGLKSKVLVDLKTILANDLNSANMSAAMDIPADKKGELDQIRIAMRPLALSTSNSSSGKTNLGSTRNYDTVQAEPFNMNMGMSELINLGNGTGQWHNQNLAGNDTVLTSSGTAITCATYTNASSLTN